MPKGSKDDSGRINLTFHSAEEGKRKAGSAGKEPKKSFAEFGSEVLPERGVSVAVLSRLLRLLLLQHEHVPSFSVPNFANGFSRTVNPARRQGSSDSRNANPARSQKFRPIELSTSKIRNLRDRWNRTVNVTRFY